MINGLKQVLLASLLVSISGTTFATTKVRTYKPDDVAQFNLTNQCNNCDLSGATLSGNHSNAAIVSTNLTGARITGTFSAAVFYGSNFSSADCSTANLSYANLTYIPLIKVNFSNADLSYANFEGSLTNDAVFDNANLYGSNISQSQLDSSMSYCGAIMPDGSKKHC